MNVRKIITTILSEDIMPGENIDAFCDEENLFEAGVLDSLSLLQFVPKLEEKFNIVIDAKEIDMESFGTIRRLEALMTSKLSILEAR